MTSAEQLSADQFIERYRPQLTPLNDKIQWFSAIPLAEDESSVGIVEPLSSLPPRLVEALPRLSIFLVPYLQGNGKEQDFVVPEAPEPETRSESFQVIGPGSASVLVAAQEISGNELHYSLFAAISSLAWECAAPEIRQEWLKALKDELRREVHGEIDEMSWAKKTALLAKQSYPFRETKLFREYVRASFIDSMTLFLHGICCDIDVEPSPRQAPSREIRRRLELLRSLYPLGGDYVLFPEELSASQGARKGRRRRAAAENGKGVETGRSLETGKSLDTGKSVDTGKSLDTGISVESGKAAATPAAAQISPKGNQSTANIGASLKDDPKPGTES